MLNWTARYARADCSHSAIWALGASERAGTLRSPKPSSPTNNDERSLGQCFQSGSTALSGTGGRDSIGKNFDVTPHHKQTLKLAQQNGQNAHARLDWAWAHPPPGLLHCLSSTRGVEARSAIRAARPNADQPGISRAYENLTQRKPLACEQQRTHHRENLDFPRGVSRRQVPGNVRIAQEHGRSRAERALRRRLASGATLNPQP